MRLRNNPKADEILANSDLVIKNNNVKYFENNNPIHIEIGMGKGDFIVGMAKKHPEINFIGIEKFSTVMAIALNKVEEESLDNVRLLNVDAINLEEFFSQKSVECIYLNFSDPWPKARHAKRRLTYHTFLDLYKKILIDGGCIKQKTDNQLLFESSIISFNQYGMDIEFVSVDLHNNDMNKDNVMSEYERKFSGLGQPIYSIHVKFKGEK